MVTAGVFLVMELGVTVKVNVSATPDLAAIVAHVRTPDEQSAA